jgi:hypothetical protein
MEHPKLEALNPLLSDIREFKQLLITHNILLTSMTVHFENEKEPTVVKITNGGLEEKQ